MCSSLFLLCMKGAECGGLSRDPRLGTVCSYGMLWAGAVAVAVAGALAWCGVRELGCGFLHRRPPPASLSPPVVMSLRHSIIDPCSTSVLCDLALRNPCCLRQVPPTTTRLAASFCCHILV